LNTTQLRNRGRAVIQRAVTGWRVRLWLLLMLAVLVAACNADHSNDNLSADAAADTGTGSTRHSSAEPGTKLAAQGEACAADFDQCRADNPRDYLTKCLPLAERCGLFTVLDGVQCATDYALCVAASPLDWTGCIQDAEQCGLILSGTGACVGEFQACVVEQPTKAIKCLEIATDCGLFAVGVLP
jgi:hypothetical protein